MTPEQRQPRADRPRIKVCGVTRIEDALLAVRLGADMIGLNFYPPSPRYLTIESASRIAAAVRGARSAAGAPLLVGVFVNEDPATVAAIDQAVGLDLLQMHGDEQPADLRPVRARAIKALRVEGTFDPSLAEPFLAAETDEDPGDSLWGLLIDTKHPDLYGGSGQSWSFASLAGVELARPVLVAGGLGPENVQGVVEAVRPWGVDVCSGVESAPGIKDPNLLTRFFEETFHVTSAAAS